MVLTRDVVVEQIADLAGIETLHGYKARDIARDTGPDCSGTVRRDETRRLSVLLVDDDEVDAKYICWLLGCINRYSFDIVHVTSSEEALAADAGRRFDLYLVDFWLMHETSIPLISELGEMHSRAPIVVLTNLNSGDIEDLGIRAGALGFLCKGDLSEKALELVISSALFTRRVEMELKERIATLEAQRETALVSGHGALLKALDKLNTAHRACDDGPAGDDAGVNAGEGAPDNALSALAGEIASARHDIFNALAAVDEPEKMAAAPQAADLRMMIARAIEAYRDEARLNGVGLAFDVPVDPLRLAVHPVLLQAFLIVLIDRVARGHPKSIAIETQVMPDSVRLAVTRDVVVDPSALQPDIDALRLVADRIGARIADNEEAGAANVIVAILPCSPTVRK